MQSVLQSVLQVQIPGGVHEPSATLYGFEDVIVIAEAEGSSNRVHARPSANHIRSVLWGVGGEDSAAGSRAQRRHAGSERPASCWPATGLGRLVPEPIG